MGLGILEGASL